MMDLNTHYVSFTFIDMSVQLGVVRQSVVVRIFIPIFSSCKISLKLERKITLVLETTAYTRGSQNKEQSLIHGQDQASMGSIWSEII